MASAFRQVATGGRREINAAEVRLALAALVDPEHGVQVQALPSGRWEIVRTSDMDAAVRAVERLSGEKGTYFSLNPCSAGLDSPITASVMLGRRWLLIDVDPERPPDTNSTDDEHEAARAVACKVMDHLTGLGWPLPVGIDSGNGWHLLYRIDLPNNALARQLIRDATHALADEFDCPAAKLDRKVHNANRVSKLPGTKARKGPMSDDRPHRWTRMVICPDQIEVVGEEQLAEIAALKRKSANGQQTAPQQPAPVRDPFKARAGDSKSQKAYAKAALRYEFARILMAPVSTRNNAVNEAAFRLGTLVGAGLLTKQEVQAELELAASLNGVLEAEPAKTRDTINRAIDDGIKQPRVVPEPKTEARPAGIKKEPPRPDGEPLTVCAASVKPLKVEWLWPDRVPKRFVTVFAGRTGLGKSFVTCDLIARLSNGGEVPFGDGECFEQGGTLFISEDPHDYMLAPRLIEHGANMGLVQFMTWEAMASYSLADTDMLDRAFSEVTTPKLVVIDPPTNFLGEADEHRNAEVRQILMRLVAWVQKVDAACILIMHVNKQTGKGIEALNRVLGSVAWVSTSRIAHSFASDPEDNDRRLFVPMKNNLGPVGSGLSYRIASTDALARVEWLAEVDITADEAMNRVAPKRRSVVASEWLIERFRKKLEWPSSELFRDAKADHISRNAIFEAKDSLNLPKARKVVSPSGDEEYHWWVPKDWPPLQLEPKEVNSSDDSETF